MQYTKIQPQRFLGSEEEEFKGIFFAGKGHGAILFIDAKRFEQINNIPSTEGPMLKSGENWSFKDNITLRTTDTGRDTMAKQDDHEALIAPLNPEY